MAHIGWKVLSKGEAGLLCWDRWLSGLAENCQMLGPHKLAPEEVSVSSYLPSSPFILIPGFSKTSGIKWTLKTQC